MKILVLKAKFGPACNKHKVVEEDPEDELQNFLNNFSRQATEMEGIVIRSFLFDITYNL